MQHMIAKANVRTIARAATLVMIFFALSRGLGLVRDVVVAAQFGTSPQYDAYLAAFKFPDFLFNVISGGALGSAFLPVFAGYLAKDDDQGAWELVSAVMNWLLVISVSLSSIVAIFAPQLVRTVIAPGFTDPAQIALTVQIMRWLLVSTVIFGVSGLFMGVLNAYQHFLLPALAPVMYNLFIIAGAWFLGPLWGVRGLAAGVIAGAVAHLLIQLPGLAHFKGRYLPTFAIAHPGVRQVGKLMAPRMLGLAAVQFNFVWDTILASWLAAGSLAGLDYGRRLMLLPQGIIAQSVAAAAFPTFSTLAAAESWDELQRAFISTLRGVLFLSIPAAVGLLMLGHPVVQLLYQRNAFNAQSTRATVWALTFYTLGLVAHSAVEILTRAFYALQNTKIPVLVGVASMLINIALSWVLLNAFASQGWAPHGGIALASSIAVTVEFLWLIALLKKLPGSLSVAPLVTPAAKMLAAGGVMALALWALSAAMRGVSIWVLTPTGIVVGAGVYAVAALLLRMDEATLIVRKIYGFIPRN